jgi:hypothetical protein
MIDSGGWAFREGVEGRGCGGSPFGDVELVTRVLEIAVFVIWVSLLLSMRDYSVIFCYMLYGVGLG